MGFYIELQIPNLSEFQSGFIRYWLASTFASNPWTQQTAPLTTAFIRLAEMALRDYEYGRHFIEQFYEGPREPNSIPIGRLLSAGGFFEACITDFHRATDCLKKIRSHPEVPQTLKSLFPKQIYFIQDRAADRVRKMRNEVQHLERLILSGTQPSGTKLFLSCDGPQRDEGGNTIKSIDRLVIGEQEIKVTELAAWLREMAQCAQIIADNR